MDCVLLSHITSVLCRTFGEVSEWKKNNNASVNTTLHCIEIGVCNTIVVCRPETRRCRRGCASCRRATRSATGTCGNNSTRCAPRTHTHARTRTRTCTQSYNTYTRMHTHTHTHTHTHCKHAHPWLARASHIK
jgi:hypothetical protein